MKKMVYIRLLAAAILFVSLLTVFRYKTVNAYVPDRPYLESVSLAAVDASRIEWERVSGATAYQVYYRVNGGPYHWLRTTTSNAVVHKKIQGGSIYYYRVRALHGSTAGEFSSALPLVTLSRAKPSLTASVSGTQAIVRWKAIKYASGYAIYRKTSNGYKLVLTTKELYYKPAGLDIYTRYSIIVRPYRVENGKRFFGTAASVAVVTARTGYLTDMMSPYNSSQCNDHSEDLFYMGGDGYTHGFTLGYNSYAFYNLHARYKTLSLIIGIDDDDWQMDENRTVYFYGDGRLIRAITIKGNTMPKTYQISVMDVVQLKISTDQGGRYTGFAEIRVSK